MMSTPILEVERVDQSFRTGFWMKRVQILHGIDLRVPGKCVMGFLGANGAGKTTLIHLVVGLRAPTAGRVRIAGMDAITRRARANIGYLPERPYFYEHLTGEGILAYFGALSGMSRNKVRDRIGTALSAVGMSHARKLELKKYSKGMLQRIGIAQAILHDPEFLVLDEPMSGLDPIGRKDMRELIQQLANEGRTVFFSTHVIPDVEAICDRVALIEKGRLIGSGAIDDLLGQGAAETEIIALGIAAEEFKKLDGVVASRDLAQGTRLVVRGDDWVRKVLDRTIQVGARIISVNPLRPSLESFFQKG